MTCDEIVKAYTKQVLHGKLPTCEEQKAGVKLLTRVLKEEDVHFDEEQFRRYMALTRYLPYKLFLWEEYIFALHNCLYTKDGELRFPDIAALCGRGAGKNGYISFESFALSTPVNGIQGYNIDIFATSEDQAKTSPDEIRGFLENNNLQSKYNWNKEIILNKATKSKITFRTSAAKTKDGLQSGMVVFDEYHAYENYKLITVAKTGLGKRPHPRTGIFTTDGNVRGGPLDDLKDRAHDILFKGIDDLGTYPFICKLDSPDEVNDELNWHKANPSLIHFKHLYNEIKKEYAEYKQNPAGSSDFMTKRMNLPPQVTVNDVTSWDNILATNRELPDLTGQPCVAGIDYAKISDMVTAGLLFYVDGIFYWLTQSWVCSQSPALGNVKAPLDVWQREGLLRYVDGVEISPEIPINWLVEMGQKYNITKLGMDNFRVSLFRHALIDAGFDVVDKNRVMLCKRVTQMRSAPLIQSAFANHKIVWGNNPLMRWFTNNTFADIDKDGNITFGKKDAKYRMTDGFMALVAAFGAASELIENPTVEINPDDIMTFTD